MKKKLSIIAGMILLSAALCLLFGAIKMYRLPDSSARIWHHTLATADPQSGITELPEDFLVDESFTSHLPIIVFDSGDEEIVSQKYYNDETGNFLYKEGVDPYVQVKLTLYDREGEFNFLGDEATASFDGSMKVRGNSSSNYAKKQYRLKILNADGEKTKYPLLGMDSASEWVLNGEFRDASHLRNYIAYNVAAEMGLESPDVRFFELLQKRGDSYEYLGLYLLQEPVQVAKGRLEFSKDYSRGEYSFLVQRDRVSDETPMLDTWSFQNGFDTNWDDSKVERDGVYHLEYPKNEAATDEVIDFATETISQIEKVLYSDQVYAYSAFSNLIDVDSFINHYILGETFMSYEFMRHSTYFYREAGGRFTVGPLWDFDGDFDNNFHGRSEYEQRAIAAQAIYNRLLLNHKFYTKMEDRYFHLRKGLLSDENLTSIAEDTGAFLGRALDRDRSRWGALSGDRDDVVEDETGILLAGSTSDPDWEWHKNELLDAVILHAHYLDENLASFEGDTLEGAVSGVGNYSLAALLFILAVVLSILASKRLRAIM